MDYSALTKMSSWGRKKALFLIETAEWLGMDLDAYGEIGANPNSGYTYLWSENHRFSLYMPINCELSRMDVYAIVANPEDGEEKEFPIEYRDLDEIEEMVDAICEEWEEGE